jgi:SAM-dependent methyltransferase
MFEQSKSAKRRFNDGNFHTKYFVGNGIDIGAGEDGLGRYMHVFRGLNGISHWDVQDGDAMLMEGVASDYYDFAHSSHSLEHMRNPQEALTNWLRIVKPNGYVIITVPDETLYEKKLWPSRFNDDHKFSFTLDTPSLPNSVNVLDLCLKLSDICRVEKIELIDEFYDFLQPINVDQTMSVTTECCIEIILQKK